MVTADRSDDVLGSTDRRVSNTVSYAVSDTGSDNAQDKPDKGERLDPFADLNPESAFNYDGDELATIITDGSIEPIGRMPGSSNITLLVKCTLPDQQHSQLAIYKPQAGERPLRDFAPGLGHREVAMYQLSEHLGWNLVPYTTWRDGPLGPGSVQAFVNANFEHHYFSLLEEGIAIDRLKQLCALDFVANNTDRKSGHCLLSVDNQLYAIDNGLSFHTDFKLRTVIWDFVGEELPDSIKATLSEELTERSDYLGDHLIDEEIDAMRERLKTLVEFGHFPADPTEGYGWPWPLV